MDLVLGLSRQLHANTLKAVYCMVRAVCICLHRHSGWLVLRNAEPACLFPFSSVEDNSFLYATANQKYPCPSENKDRLLHLLGDSGLPFSVVSLISNEPACGLELGSQQTFTSHPRGIWSCAWPTSPPEHLSFFLFLRAVLHIRERISNLFLLHPDFQPYLFLVLHKYLIFFFNVMKSARLFSLLLLYFMLC